METPHIEIDRSIMIQNIQRMSEKAAELGVELRPHAKTHKIPELAKLQIEFGAKGITVAKAGEAEVMANAGIQDIFIAYPLVVPSKIKRALFLSRKAKIIFGVESLEGAGIVADTADKMGLAADVRLEVDTGLKRTGAVYDQAVRLAKQIREYKSLRLNGIYTYRGALLNGEPTLNVREAGREEGELMAALAVRLREHQLDIRDVSAGSTPTALYAAEVPGVTEIRPGTYIFNDQMQAAIGACRPQDCAAKVVVTVVGVREDGLVVIDGGSKAFATDVPPGGVLGLKGFGAVTDYPDAVFERMNEEHGVLRMNGSHGLKPGDQLAIIPNHICSTVNLHNEVVIKEANKHIPVKVAARGKLH